MTVEQQQPLPSYSRAQRQQENVDYAKIKEITGICDHHRITEAINACSNEKGLYELEEVINILLTDSNESTSKAVVPYQVKRENQTASPGLTVDVIDATPHKTPDEQLDHDKQQQTQRIPLQSEQANPAAKPGSSGAVIDLTNETPDQEDLQKAIAASLQESQGILGGQVTREEQEISRALEASLLESKAGTKRKRGDLWFVDPLNPHERKRKEGWPVGLKNVGNTCWFSAVIQSLFHLPVFRRLVLSFVGPVDVQGEENRLENRNFQFMTELRRLFALMVASHRKYVDPSKAVEILKEAFSVGAGIVDNQQDVSEFQHKLLDWLEDAFRTYEPVPQGASGPSEAGNPQPNKSNPMVQLFYGEVLSEGVNEGKSFQNKETFGQFPLQVDGFRDIHESLEAMTADGEIEALSMEMAGKSGQEQWFARLPPVLTFELSRFQFNQQIGRPEKIHNKLVFPDIIYMDRYMECNREITRQKREELKRLKEQLLELQNQLDKFTHYGSGPKRFPLQDVLQYALEFAQSRPEVSTPHTPQDIEMESPKSHVSMLTESPTPRPASSSASSSPTHPLPSSSPSAPHNPNATAATAAATTTTLSPVPCCSSVSTQTPKTPPHSPLGSPRRLMAMSTPTPRFVSPDELDVLQTCLRRWRTEVETDVKELQDGINRLDESVNSMYNHENLKQHPYKLHAVLVHEGQAASGHYWAYVYSKKHNGWLKFNDITVSETGWEDVEKESVGGYHNASAYCLMYIDSKQADLLDSHDDSASAEDMFNSLPPDLREYVKDDNEKFKMEIQLWDAEQKKRALQQQQLLQQQQQQQQQAASGDAVQGGRSMDTRAVEIQIHGDHGVSTGTQAPAPRKVVAPCPIPLPQSHAVLAYKYTLPVIKRAIESDTFKNKGAAEALKEACSHELKRLENISKMLPDSLPNKDPRLMHVVIYMLVNDAPRESVLQRAVLEAFTYLTQSENSPERYQLWMSAKEAHNALVRNPDDERRVYHKWHEMYADYRLASLLMINGIDRFHRDCYAEALPMLCRACEINDRLVATNHPMRGHSTKLLYYYRRQCILHLNESVCQQFETEESIEGVLDLTTTYILPVLAALSATPYQDDQSAVEEVREKWCSFLGKDIGHKVEKLQEFLSRLFDPPTETRGLPDTSRIRETLRPLDDDAKLCDLYETVIRKSEESGYLEHASNSK